MLYFRKRGRQCKLTNAEEFMILNDEIYFEITMTGTKAEIKRIVKFLKSGELDDFFEISSDFISYDDSYSEVDDSGETSIVFSSDDYGIEVDEFDTDDFLEVICRAAKNLDLVGSLYDINDEEYNFKSDAGNSYYIDKSKVTIFNEDEELGKDEENEETDE